jgi:hypothetical protein
VNDDLLPRWCVHEDTPAGPRWYYPLGDMPTRSDVITTIASDQHGRITVDTDRKLIVADHKLTTVTWTGRPVSRTLGYELADPAAVSEKFPASITPDEFRALAEEDEDLAWRLYRRVAEDRPGEQHAADFTHHQVLANGGLDEHTQYRWYNGVGHELFAPFEHLRPGQLHGVWDYVAEVLRPLPHVKTVYTNGTEIAVYLSLPWDEPQTWWRDRYGVNGKKLRGQEKVVSTHVDKRLELRLPRAIFADSKAAAVAKLDRLIADTVEAVRGMNVTACSTCKGHGYITATYPTKEGSDAR